MAQAIQVRIVTGSAHQPVWIYVDLALSLSVFCLTGKLCTAAWLCSMRVPGDQKVEQSRVPLRNQDDSPCGL